MKNGFNSILVANRGEIALRIMRSVRAKGMKCIAIYTKADSAAPFVRFADQAILIGDGPVEDSYLSISKIIEAGTSTKADAIHPGYGFLSENFEFAKAVEESGIKFIGPSSEVIKVMGNKADAKRRMIAEGVPCIPGYEGHDQSDDTLISAANLIGFPVMVKAASGGGGRGMRFATDKSILLDCIHSARSEALKFFGSNELILEKGIVNPHHIEVQIFGDKFSNIIHFGERDCSVQRRHQKVIEEAPSLVLDKKLRESIAEVAIKVAKAIDYEGAGTVEFIVDPDGNFYFMEMNTRLQVEHPVTELITGFDLVSLQIDVAQGQKLTVNQKDISFLGHSMEARLYAEDPFDGFLPSSGEITFWREPELSGIRIDSGIVEKQVISTYYDPMLVKLISHGKNRDDARKLLISALEQSPVFGLKSNRDHLIDLLQKDQFAAGSVTTGFISETYGDLGPNPPKITFREFCIAAALIYRDEQNLNYNLSHCNSEELLGWGSSGSLRSWFKLKCGDEIEELSVICKKTGELSIINDLETKEVHFNKKGLYLDNVLVELVAHLRINGVVSFALRDYTFEFNELNNALSLNETEVGSRITAPMHGILNEIFVENDQFVKKGDRLAILEAMKLQHEIIALIDGKLKSTNCSVGEQVSAGDILFELELGEEFL